MKAKSDLIKDARPAKMSKWFVIVEILLGRNNLELLLFCGKYWGYNKVLVKEGRMEKVLNFCTRKLMHTGFSHYFSILWENAAAPMQ